MGIHQLSKLLQHSAKPAIKNRDISYFTGQRIAIDASLSLYQFLIAVRSDGAGLTTDSGDTTSHLIGTFYRTIRIVTSGIKPLFVFDGLPPELKLSHELEKRKEKRDAAAKEYEMALETGDKEQIEKFDKRKVKVTKKHVDDCKKLLDLMKVPYVVAPSEAEAYAAYLCIKGVVDAVATEDMDALTFGAPILLRNLNAAENKKLPIVEYNLKEILKELKINHNQFIDVCIMLGCDYVKPLRGFGPKRAYEMILKHKDIETILEKEKIKSLESTKNENSSEADDIWNFEEARIIFNELPHVSDEIIEKMPEIDFDKIVVDDVVKFLVHENGFSEERVLKGLERFKSAKEKKKQVRIESFFKKVD
ncbi:hypothetical protein EDEG_00228 [Edhazardia aedis USNM 41457]|uniref:Flap endonuclease 1 n=1 Tax=Edhazardia aedis (strain USNM 41457) TaxID=1003232 RepID=J8ZU99_EDHAE|nr:hypothetical protein EDEG_00228 [Edhazardia aedis USNM 41457]|eukprot:EJW03248.1 hypothetical protein EDEG_00228 [Edhazardia aedis USNM 41457]